MRFAKSEGRTLVVGVHGGEERCRFATAAEAQARAAFITEGLSWLGTPFLDCGDVKGPAGCVDCAMLLVRCSVDTGRFAPFDPRPYSPRHMLRKGAEEKFLGIIRDDLGAREVERPCTGDVAVWWFGHCFCHGGIIINSGEVLHAYAADGAVVISGLDNPLLNFIPVGEHLIPRPVKYFDLWARARPRACATGEASAKG